MMNSGAQARMRKLGGPPTQVGRRPAGVSGFIWITWENCRRTKELSAALGVPVYEIRCGGPYVIRTTVQLVRTVAMLWQKRPPGVIVQNPSMVLAWVACVLKPLFRYRLVVDRHTALMCEIPPTRLPARGIVNYLNRYTARKADLTIVTNDYLKRLVEERGGRGFVLQDKLPDLRSIEVRPSRLIGKHNIAYICSFLRDEPVDEVLEAARQLDYSTVIYVTGNGRKYLTRRQGEIPANVVFTGFLCEPEFVSLLTTADAVIVLTKRQHTLLCGAYEAISLGKPLILSDTACLRDYFTGGPVFTPSKAADIAAAIRTVARDKIAIGSKIVGLRAALQRGWECSFKKLQETLASL